MREFALSEQFFPAQRRRLLMQALPALVAFAGMMAIHGGQGSFVQPGYWLGVLVGAVLIALLAPSMMPGERQWRPFRIVVHPDAVQATRRPGRRDVVIRADDLVSVREVPGRSLVLRGPAPYQTIEVPAELENYAQLRELVARWRSPVITSRSALRAAIPWIAMIAALGVIWGITVSPSLHRVFLSRWVIAIWLVGALWVLLRDRYMPRNWQIFLGALIILGALLALTVPLVTPGLPAE